MECNKEEAVRAKDIAVSKMLNKDFLTARKIALKAQRLYEDLENISQMLLVCDVHCAAEQKLFGSVMDWYGILQVERTVDEATIKKQYRKLALQLHPDKNKFPGAEAAFKLIGEAQRVLLDGQKRSAHDSKRKATTNKPAPPYRSHQTQRAAPNSAFGVQSNFNRNFTGVNFQHPAQSAAQHGFSNGRPTFWTACPFCNVRFQFYIEIINKSIICQSCNKPFTAYERSATGGPTPNIFTQPVFPQKKDVQNHSACKVELGQRGSVKVGQSETEFFQKKGSSTEFCSERVNHKKRKKQESESSESCASESSNTESSASESSSDESEADIITEKDEEFKAGTNFGSSAERPRRSDRRRQHVSYKENVSDDEDEELVIPSKKTKGSKSPFAVEEDVNGLKDDVSEKYKQSGVDADLKAQNVKGKEKVEENGCEKDSDYASDTSSGSIANPQTYVYPDPEFKDFDKGRQEEGFKVGQIWAAYDTLDAMPRYYTRIKKVFSPGFKVQITWLEPNPDDKDKLEWVEEGLPVSCGKFKHGITENNEDRLMFSHLMLWENDGQRDTYKIVPRKGETWALFKDWDINWKSDASSRQGEYEYEFVEILSEYNERVGVSVAYLGKVMGFVSLFCRISKGGRDSFQITPSELYRFSHKIPSFRLTGNEKTSVPKGSLELDPAALPRNIEEISVPKDSDSFAVNAAPSSSFSRATDEVKIERMPSEASASACKADANGPRLQPDNSDCDVDKDCSSPDSLAGDIECPEPEFFNFDAAKSSDKFEEGQIWALYSDEEGLPKYYGKIIKVDEERDFEVLLRWLAPCPLSKDMIHWQDKDMPICCGRFMVNKKGKPRPYSSTNPFSHQVRPVTIANGTEYTILPKNGEVWALYKNWSSKLKCEDLKSYEYSIVEVLRVNDSSISVSFLERIGGFNAVFKARGSAGGTANYPFAELLRFSHQIPAFRLTGERDGSLRGFWELDPAALPVGYYSKK